MVQMCVNVAILAPRGGSYRSDDCRLAAVTLSSSGGDKQGNGSERNSVQIAPRCGSPPMPRLVPDPLCRPPVRAGIHQRSTLRELLEQRSPPICVKNASVLALNVLF